MGGMVERPCFVAPVAPVPEVSKRLRIRSAHSRRDVFAVDLRDGVTELGYRESALECRFTELGDQDGGDLRAAFGVRIEPEYGTRERHERGLLLFERKTEEFQCVWVRLSDLLDILVEPGIDVVGRRDA